MGNLTIVPSGQGIEPPHSLFRPPPASVPTEYRADPLLLNAWEAFVARWQEHYDAFHGLAVGLWNDLQGAEQALKRIQDQERGRKPAYWPWYVYLIALLVLFGIEVPFNQQAFEFVFLSTRNVSWVVATIIAISLLMIAHFAGLRIRQFWHNVAYFRDRYNPTGGLTLPALLNVIVILFLLSFAGALIYIVSIFRQGYVALVSSANGTRVDVAAVLRETLNNLQLETSGWMMFAINTGILIAALICCMSAHDARPGYAEADIKAADAKSRWEALIKRYDSKIAQERRILDDECRAVRDAHELGH